MKRILFLSILSFVVATLLNECSPPHKRSPSSTASFLDESSVSPHLCGAIRGNGELMLAHMSSLALLTENFGPFDALAGGSSASYSIFIYESILQNPSLWNCGDTLHSNKKCSREEAALRISLLLKSVYSYVDLVKNSEDVKKTISIVEKIKSLKEKTKAIDLPLITETPGNDFINNLKKTEDDFLSLLNSPEYRTLINPRFLSILIQGHADTVLDLPALTETPNDSLIRAYRLREAKEMIMQFGSFKAESKNILFRPGLLSFDRIAQKFAQIANFYAGRFHKKPEELAKYQKEISQFFNQCAHQTRGLSWFKILQSQKSCANQIVSLIEGYNKTYQLENSPASRLNDRVGHTLKSLIVSALVEDKASTFKEVSRKYLNTPGIQFKPSDFNVFQNVRFGYFGASEDLDRLKENSKTSIYKNDFKMKNLKIISNPLWREVLNYSPAEPGLNELTLAEQLKFSTVLEKGDLSAAGWGDLTPSIALKNIGCKNVFYITRRGPESSFLRGVVSQLGASKAELDQLYDLSLPDSSYNQSLRASDAVWCTDWNAPELAAPAVEALDQSIADKTFLQSSDPERIKLMLFSSQSKFLSKIKTPFDVGCGGQ